MNEQEEGRKGEDGRGGRGEEGRADLHRGRGLSVGHIDSRRQSPAPQEASFGVWGEKHGWGGQRSNWTCRVLMEHKKEVQEFCAETQTPQRPRRGQSQRNPTPSRRSRTRTGPMPAETRDDVEQSAQRRTRTGNRLEQGYSTGSPWATSSPQVT